MANPNLISDGTTNFSGGQDAFSAPKALTPNKYHIGINTTGQKGILGPRWALNRKTLDFSKTGFYTRQNSREVSYEEVFYSGKFQAFIPYSVGPNFFNLWVVSGFIFLISLYDYSVQVLNPTDKVDPKADRVYWSNAGNYLVIFDFPNVAFILTGLEIARADLAKNETPISQLGAYNQNRLFVANAGSDFTGGDPAGSTLTPKAPVTFNEVNQNSSPYVGQIFQLTTNYNNDSITAMGFLQVTDTSTGIGPLLVASRRAIYSYRTDLPRSQWEAGQFGSVLVYSVGITGQRAQINVNSDLIFLSGDGQVRALSMARNDQKRWSNVPISKEVSNFITYTDQFLDTYAFCSYYKNKIFVSCNPYRVDCLSAEGTLQTDYVHGGVVVLELDNLAGLGEESPPVWAGLWTGTRFLDMCENNGIFYVAGKEEGKNYMYIMDPSKTYDDIEGKVRYIHSVVITKEYTCGDETINKEIHSMDLGLSALEEMVNVQASYKPSHVPFYTSWREFIFDAPVNQCSAFPEFPNGLAPKSIRDLNLGGVDETLCSGNYESLFRFKGTQIKLEISGKNWELDYIKLRAKVIPDNVTNVKCESDSPVEVPSECFDPWYIPPTEEC